MDGLCMNPGIHGVSPAIDVPRVSQLSVVAKITTPFSRFSFRRPLRSFWPGIGRRSVSVDGGGDEKVVMVVEEEATTAIEEQDETENWILKILHVRSLWSGGDRRSEGCCGVEEVGDFGRRDGSDVGDGDCDGCRVDNDDGDREKEAEFDRDSFSRLLRRVSLSEAKLYAQMSYLGNIAYCISKIQTENLLRCYNLRFVTSSIDKRELLAKAEKSMDSGEVREESEDSKDTKQAVEMDNQNNSVYRISPSSAYHIAASAASYLQSHTKSLIPFSPLRDDSCEDLPGECCSGSEGIRMMNSEMASLIATTDSVTSVVAAKEEVKQAVADDLNSTLSSPCEWFVCDDDQTGTRFFAIQGSETLASWQANLLFEPVKFEGLDVIVHRGIYEAAKGMYEQMLPEIRAHLKSHGSRATLRFTGHSLGGSLALLINLMLLIRNEAPASSLLPVITFGAPSIMCGGDNLLRSLGLPRSHVKAITMHRDIVPRAFSCHYPNHVAEFLKAVNGNFRNHPCLNTQNLLYAPMGDLVILQPDEKFSPSHELLPSGIGLYVLTSPTTDGASSEKHLRAAKSVFLNSPHPLEILRDRSSYGSEGTVQRDHDMNSYLKCVRGFIRQELIKARKAKRERRRKNISWWAPRIIVGPRATSSTAELGQGSSNFSGIVRTGRDSLRRFSRLVASQHMHLFVVLLFPARMFLLGAYSVVSIH